MKDEILNRVFAAALELGENFHRPIMEIVEGL